MWECLVLLVFPPTGIWVEPVGLGGSAALVTFQRGEIPANPSGKGTPVCTSEFPWNPLVLLQLGIVVTHTSTSLGRIVRPTEPCPAWHRRCLENSPGVAQLGSELQQKC